MSSSGKRISKRKGSKVTFKQHKKHQDSSFQSVMPQESTATPVIRPEDIKMHS